MDRSELIAARHPRAPLRRIASAPLRGDAVKKRGARDEPIRATIAVVAVVLTGLPMGAFCRQIAAPASNASAEPSTPPQSFLIPKGTAVLVQLMRGVIVTRGAQSDSAQFEVAQDAIVDGHLIARAGDPARGTIDVAEGAGPSPARRREFIAVRVESITNYCGDAIHVAFTRSEARVKQSNARLTLTLPTMPGRFFITTLDRPQTVCGEQTNASGKPFPADSLRSF